MKFFFILVVVLIGLWFWKQRQKKTGKPSAPAQKQDAQVIMLKCAVCGLHVPDTDALAGQRGAYCSAEHRRQAEGL